MNSQTKTLRPAPAKKRVKKLRGDIETIGAMPLCELGLRKKLFNLLTGDKKKKIRTIGDLYNFLVMNEAALLKIPRLGATSIQECYSKLEANGFTFD